MTRAAAYRLPLATRLWVTFGGSGLAPKAPGTMGSLASVAVAWPMAYAGQQLLYIVAALLVFALSIPIVEKAIRQAQVHDPGWIVIDETCGQWITFAFVSPALLLAHPWLFAAGFALFRFFDILKPLGIRRVEKLPGAWGIMADDLLGGVYAGLILAFIARWI